MFLFLRWDLAMLDQVLFQQLGRPRDSHQIIFISSFSLFFSFFLFSFSIFFIVSHLQYYRFCNIPKNASLEIDQMSRIFIESYPSPNQCWHNKPHVSSTTCKEEAGESPWVRRLFPLALNNATACPMGLNHSCAN